MEKDRQSLCEDPEMLRLMPYYETGKDIGLAGLMALTLIIVAKLCHWI